MTYCDSNICLFVGAICFMFVFVFFFQILDFESFIYLFIY